MDSEAEIARASGLTKALSGTALHAAGEQYFSQLRTAIGKALLGTHHNTQPYLACTCIPPTYWVRSCMSFKQPWSKPESFFFLLQLVHEPSSCMWLVTLPNPRDKSWAHYLSKITWFCDAAGHVQTPWDVKLHILDSNMEDLRHFVHLSWMIIVSDQLVTRKHWRGAPVIDRSRTLKAVCALPEGIESPLAWILQAFSC